MRRYLTKFARPAAMLLAVLYLIGAVPSYCAHCFAPVAGTHAQPDNQTAGMVAARCQCSFQLSGIHHSSGAAVNTAKAYSQPVPVTGAVVALLDVTGSVATRRTLSDHLQFRSPSRVLNYGVRLE